MVATATGQPPPGVVQVPTTTPNPLPAPQPQIQSYKSIFNSNNTKEGEAHCISAPNFDYHHGEPQFIWIDKDVENMVIHEELQFAVVGKFSYGMPDYHELCKQIPLQCEIKGQCSIGFLESRYVLIRLSLLEDYVHLLSKPAFYVKVANLYHQMRGFKYDVWFDPREETSIAVAWISFPGLPPVFFGKEAMFALATAVGRPLHLDVATKAKSRPSCAKIKVEVDLLASRPQRVRIGIKNSITGETRFKWVRIKYDYIPKFCKECRLQGHTEEECFVLHPELEHNDENEMVEATSLHDEPVKILQSGKVVSKITKGDALSVPKEAAQKKNISNGNATKQAAQEKNKDAGQAAQGLGNQRKYDRSLLHPNRNPNAWSKVESKKKKPKDDVTHGNQGDTVVTNNAFALLDNNEVDDRQQVQKGKEREELEDTIANEPIRSVVGKEQHKSAVGSGDLNVGKAKGVGGLTVCHAVNATPLALPTVEALSKDIAANNPSLLNASYNASAANTKTGNMLNDSKNKATGNAAEQSNIDKTEENRATKSESAAESERTAGRIILIKDTNNQIGDHAQNIKVEDGRIILKDVTVFHDESGPACLTLNNATAGKATTHVPAVEDHMRLINQTEGGRPHASQTREAEQNEDEEHVQCNGEQSNMLNLKCSMSDDAHALSNALVVPNKDAHELSFSDKAEENGVHTKVSMILRTAALKGDFPPNDLIYLNQVGSFSSDEAGNLRYLLNGSSYGFEFSSREEDVTVSLEEEELDEESIAYNFSNVASEGDLSPRPICDNAQKKVIKEIRPLEPTREQPSRSTKSQKYKEWKNSKK